MEKYSEIVEKDIKELQIIGEDNLKQMLLEYVQNVVDAIQLNKEDIIRKHEERRDKCRKTFSMGCYKSAEDERNLKKAWDELTKVERFIDNLRYFDKGEIGEWRATQINNLHCISLYHRNDQGCLTHRFFEIPDTIRFTCYLSPEQERVLHLLWCEELVRRTIYESRSPH